MLWWRPSPALRCDFIYPNIVVVSNSENRDVHPISRARFDARLNRMPGICLLYFLHRAHGLQKVFIERFDRMHCSTGWVDFYKATCHSLREDRLGTENHANSEQPYCQGQDD